MPPSLHAEAQASIYVCFTLTKLDCPRHRALSHHKQDRPTRLISAELGDYSGRESSAAQRDGSACAIATRRVLAAVQRGVQAECRLSAGCHCFFSRSRFVIICGRQHRGVHARWRRWWGGGGSTMVYCGHTHAPPCTRHAACAHHPPAAYYSAHLLLTTDF